MHTDKYYTLKRRAAFISLIVGFLMLIAKMGAYLVTGSAAIFSDAAESVVHIFATSMALMSIIISSKPADQDHMYGHGNIEYFSAGIEGALILVAAAVIIYQSVIDIIHGTELKSLNVGVLVIAGAGITNMFLGFYLMKTGKKTESLTLIADGKHILTDSVTSIGVVIGIILVMITDLSILDPVVAIIVALNILRTGYSLIRTSIGGLMLETDPAILQDITQLLSSIKKEYWIDVHELRYWKSGDKMFIDFHMILPFYSTIEQTHREEKEIAEKFRQEMSNAQVKIHFDYCRYELCKYCTHGSCEKRKEEKSINFDWNVEKLTGDAVFRIHN
jgi:cation diffusion facilitator family transporter